MDSRGVSGDVWDLVEMGDEIEVTSVITGKVNDVAKHSGRVAWIRIVTNSKDPHEGFTTVSRRFGDQLRIVRRPLPEPIIGSYYRFGHIMYRRDSFGKHLRVPDGSDVPGVVSHTWQELTDKYLAEGTPLTFIRHGWKGWVTS